MEKIKDIFLIVCIVGFGVLLNIIRVEYKIPVTIIDIIFFPASIVLSFLILKMVVSKNLIKYKIDQTTVKSSLISFFLFTLIVIPLSSWGILSGISAPFDYFSGIKGSGHGYTLSAIGIFLLILWAVFACEIYIKLTCKDE